ncbi:hypothetical protein [Peribacillus saganii]|nr:hypothetical protein [Peribacillus saganii]
MQTKFEIESRKKSFMVESTSVYFALGDIVKKDVTVIDLAKGLLEVFQQ